VTKFVIARNRDTEALSGREEHATLLASKVKHAPNKLLSQFSRVQWSQQGRESSIPWNCQYHVKIVLSYDFQYNLNTDSFGRCHLWFVRAYQFWSLYTMKIRGSKMALNAIIMNSSFRKLVSICSLKLWTKPWKWNDHDSW
jgi:hypothetical protein